jgi:hypothetical protein
MTTRPRRRRSFVLALALVVALAATLAVRLYSAARLERALERFESTTGGLRFAELAPARVDPRHQNAAFWLRNGADLMVDGSPEWPTALERRTAEIGSPWSDADQKVFLAVLAANEPARALLDRAASLERSSFEIEYKRGADAEIPNFVPLLRLARHLALECDFHQQRGDLSSALESLHLLERLAAAQRAEPFLLALLTGAGTERLYFDRLEAILRDVRNVDTLRAIARDLDHLDAATVPGPKVIAADVAATYPSLLRPMPPWPDLFPEPGDRRLLRWLHPLLRATGLDRLTAALYVEVGQRAAEAANDPTADYTLERFERDVLRLHRLPPGLEWLARLLGPNYLNAIQREQWGRSARALARLAVELSLSRAGHGAYPTAPTLPVSAATGETATFATGADGSLEIAFPRAEAAWATEKSRWSQGPMGVIGKSDFNLRWRLPP